MSCLLTNELKQNISRRYKTGFSHASFVLFSCALLLVSVLAKADNEVSSQSDKHSLCGTKSSPDNMLLYDAKPLGEWIDIKAEEVNYQPNNKLELTGRVELNQGRYQAKSESATIDQVIHHALLEGKVELRSPDLILRGDHANLNLDNQQVSISNARFSNPKTLINGEAAEISQPDKDTLIIHDGLFTSCPPQSRSWAFAADKITLNRDLGFGQAKNTRFLIHDTPVFYIPWFSFPIDNRRKSGFLYPLIGSSNTESGLFVSTPYYLNLAPNYDAILTPSFISGRGFHNEVEARHKSSVTDSIFIGGYIKNDKQFNDEQSALGKEDPGARWGVNFEQDVDTFAGGWKGQLNYSAVSDNDYLNDLNQGINIDRQDNLDRRAEFYFSRENWRLGVLLQQFKSLDDQILASEEAYQRLPEVNLEVNQTLNAFQLDWQSQYVYFYRDRKDLVASARAFGSRVRFHPRLSLPLTKSWGYINPAVTIDQTDYFLQDYTPVDNHISRTIPIYEFDSGLYFDRKTHFGKQSFQQSLEPRIYYVYSEDKNQNAIPNFDSTLPSFNYQRLFTPNRFTGGDRVADNNRLTVGITSRWTDLNSGKDRAVFSLGQIYHYDDRSVNIEGLGYSNRSDSLLASELLFRPIDGLEFEMTGLWDARTNETSEGNSRLQFYTANYQSVVNFSHRYIRNELEQMDSSFITPIYNELSLIGRWRYDLDKKRTIGTLAGVEYNSCCWRVQVLGQSYLNSDAEILNGVLFRFQLKGVGGFGQSINSMDKQVAGYKAREAQFN